MLHCEQLMTIIIRTMDQMSRQFSGHTERVAYGLMRVLEGDPRFSPEEVDRLVCTALFHDIGILHNEEDNNFLEQESTTEWAHPRYSYFYLKNLGPFPEDAEFVLYHHSGRAEIEASNMPDRLKQAANYLVVLDALDFYYVNDPGLTIREEVQILDRLDRERYHPEAVQAVTKLAMEPRPPKTREQILDALLRRLGKMKMGPREENALINVLMGAIDFRNHFTVVHSFVVVHIADQMARWCGLGPRQREAVHFGAMFHDLGKVAIPGRILENPQQLAEEDWRIMRSHVQVTGEILRGCVSEEVYRIAVRHHESWDGTGYPQGLGAKELTLGECIVRTADVFSALAEERSYKPAYSLQEVLESIDGLTRQGKLNPAVTATVQEHQQEIYGEVQRVTRKAQGIYDRIRQEFSNLVRGAAYRPYYIP